MKRASLFFLFFYSLFFFSHFTYAEISGEVAEEKMAAIPDLLGEDDFDQDWEDDFFLQELTISDPLEPMNRVFFTINDKLYYWVMKPVSDGYSWALPYELRESFGNLFTNLGAPVRMVNSLLQGDFQKSWVVLKRFVINSTAGVLGMTDVARLDFDLEPQRADFGQTLGRWGVDFGPYLFWPLLGPSSVRDTFGLGVDVYLHPVTYGDLEWEEGTSYYLTKGVNTLSLNPGAYEEMRRITFDPYVAVRQAYYDYRVQLIKKKSKER